MCMTAKKQNTQRRKYCKEAQVQRPEARRFGI